MTAAGEQARAASGCPDAAAASRRPTALVVGDSAVQRRVLSLMLARWSFDVVEAGDGAEALETCRRRPPDFVICDWMMPGMTGPALCRAIRRLELPSYVYILLVTARAEPQAVAEGLDAGADDYLSKPPDAAELHARLRAGGRILAMQAEMADRNRRLGEAFDRLSAAHDDIQRDLRAAARLQSALMPPRRAVCAGAGIGTIWRPAGHVGGDLVGFFPVSGSRLAAYALDVSGHGVPAALMTARLAHLFGSRHRDESLAMHRAPCGTPVLRDPAALATLLNARLQDEADSDQYFTMLYADVDTASGLVRFVQAGHPAPAVLRRDGSVEFPGAGGAPVGLLPGAAWETVELRLAPGERLVLLSDGVTECADAAGAFFETAGLVPLLAETRALGEDEQLDRLVQAMAAFAGTGRFADDVSALVLTMP